MNILTNMLSILMPNAAAGAKADAKPQQPATGFAALMQAVAPAEPTQGLRAEGDPVAVPVKNMAVSPTLAPDLVAVPASTAPKGDRAAPVVAPEVVHYVDMNKPQVGVALQPAPLTIRPVPAPAPAPVPIAVAVDRTDHLPPAKADAAVRLEQPIRAALKQQAGVVVTPDEILDVPVEQDMSVEYAPVRPKDVKQPVPHFEQLSDPRGAEPENMSALPAVAQRHSALTEPASITTGPRPEMDPLPFPAMPVADLPAVSMVDDVAARPGPLPLAAGVSLKADMAVAVPDGTVAPKLDRVVAKEPVRHERDAEIAPQAATIPVPAAQVVLTTNPAEITLATEQAPTAGVAADPKAPRFADLEPMLPARSIQKLDMEGTDIAPEGIEPDAATIVAEPSDIPPAAHIILPSPVVMLSGVAPPVALAHPASTPTVIAATSRGTVPEPSYLASASGGTPLVPQPNVGVKKALSDAPVEPAAGTAVAPEMATAVTTAKPQAALKPAIAIDPTLPDTPQIAARVQPVAVASMDVSDGVQPAPSVDLDLAIAPRMAPEIAVATNMPVAPRVMEPAVMAVPLTIAPASAAPDVAAQSFAGSRLDDGTIEVAPAAASVPVEPQGRREMVADSATTVPDRTVPIVRSSQTPMPASLVPTSPVPVAVVSPAPQLGEATALLRLVSGELDAPVAAMTSVVPPTPVTRSKARAVAQPLPPVTGSSDAATPIIISARTKVGAVRTMPVDIGTPQVRELPHVAPVIEPSVAVAAPAAIAMPAPVNIAASLGQQVIDMGSSGQWIDGLAREIAALSAGEGKGSFRLSPEHLGPMRVDIRPGANGADVTLTVETKAAEAMLVKDRSQLQADGQLAAVNIGEVKIERVAHVAEIARADNAMGQGSMNNPSSGQGNTQATLAQSQSGANNGGHGQHNRKVSTDAAVSNHAEPQDQGRDAPGDVRRARYA